MLVNTKNLKIMTNQIIYLQDKIEIEISNRSEILKGYARYYLNFQFQNCY